MTAFALVKVSGSKGASHRVQSNREKGWREHAAGPLLQQHEAAVIQIKCIIVVKKKKKNNLQTHHLIEHSSMNSSKNPEPHVKRKKKQKNMSHKQKYMEAADELTPNNTLFHQLFTTTHGGNTQNILCSTRTGCPTEWYSYC